MHLLVVVIYLYFSSFFSLGKAEEKESELELKPKFETSAQGFLTYRQYQSFENLVSTTPYWKKEVDIRVLELKGEYKIDASSEIELEIEFEHGGTGTSMEYDAFDEFGEFESEVEKGGEIVLSEFYYKHTFPDHLWLKVGKIPVRISLGNMQDHYLMYPSVFSSSAESYMLPQDWREIGVEGHKTFGPFNWRLAVVNGLNSEFFRKYNWIGGGYQKKFESVNAENLAAQTSIQYGDIVKGDGIGVAAYYGNTTDNRYKKGKVFADGHVFLYSLMGVGHLYNWRFRGQLIQGSLENSDKISKANANMGTLLNPGAFSSLGHVASLSMLEISYRWELGDNGDLIPFMSYQHVDTMKSVQGEIIRDDRYDQLITSVGAMWSLKKALFAKAEFLQSSTALKDFPDIHEYRVGLGFDLSSFD